jgi:hypothetical protein
VSQPVASKGPLAERAKLQGELNRINAEIDTLKRRPRGIRDDYRLRGRMADAEAIARRLTELDTRLGPLGRPAPSPEPAQPEVQVSPSDDRAERDAKADILADQARRLTGEANRLEGRIVGLRTRNELKRRSGQLERDPFSPLEQAKGRVGVSTAQSASVPKNTVGVPSAGATDSVGGGATPVVMPATPPVQDSPVSMVGQLRGVLDAASLEEVRRLEAPGATPVNLAVMERALATLRGRAAQLSAAATSLRGQTPKAP